MKKLLTLLVLFVAIVTGASAAPTATLIDQSNGNVDKVNFRTTSSSSQKSGGYNIDEKSYGRYIQLGGAYTTPIGVSETKSFNMMLKLTP